MATSTELPIFRTAGRQSPARLIREGLTEIWSRQRLARYIVQADLHRHGADTLLGNVWWILDPLLQMAVYVVLVTVISHTTKPDFPLFVFSAVLPWKWFSAAVNDAITSVTSRERIIKQVRFPKIVLPFAATIAGIANFSFGLIPLVGMMLLFYRDRMSLFLLLIPLVAVVQFFFTLGFAVVLSAVNVFFRDVANVARHALRLWFYLSPGLYAAKDVSGSHRLLETLYNLNPWATLFESYRALIYNDTYPDWGALLLLLVESFVLLIFAIFLFKRVETSFAKVL